TADRLVPRGTALLREPAKLGLELGAKKFGRGRGVVSVFPQEPSGIPWFEKLDAHPGWIRDRGAQKPSQHPTPAPPPPGPARHGTQERERPQGQGPGWDAKTAQADETSNRRSSREQGELRMAATVDHQHDRHAGVRRRSKKATPACPAHLVA